MTLSPAAQAVLDAWSKDENGVYLEGDPERLAYALRAAADQVVPEDSPLSFVPGGSRSFALQRRATRHELLAIADELEGQ
jgi:hypothetical protein